ncbi:DUF1990 domain-containing protein [Nocardia sp. NBC_01503]|uniref:DUF1990 family protein n=1 Tax=Nocardia sp. NBC_01503 TaxID=2975997 RepID=UPI002E7BFF1D|nr:DUF1990 domain-containing protein [Nocardia sp. NBC_01503]WTL30282.1 DUF1990 domain-containing protein [Nocardia sp. NBC_01503]
MPETDPAGDAEGLNYGPVGGTRPADSVWSATFPGYRRYERTATIGHGEADWRAACSAVMEWEVKRRSGFHVEPVTGSVIRATEGEDYRITAAFGPLTIREPVRVVATVRTLIRCGFAYGTLPGHPVSGEEAFVVHRSPDGTVWLTLRSLTRPARSTGWRLLFPVLILAQRRYRRRYLRALRPRY